MKLGTLLKQATDTPRLPRGFTQSVHQRIQLHTLQQKKGKLFRDAVLLGGTLLLFCYMLSVFLVNTIAIQTLDFFSLVAKHPDLLWLSEGRSALLEAIPITSLLLLCLTAGCCYKLLQVFLRDIKPFGTLLFYRHASS